MVDLVAERNARRAKRRAGNAKDSQPSPALAKPSPSLAKPSPALVGDVLTDLIRKKTGKPPCARFCRETAKKMNAWGVIKCRENVDELAAEIHANVKRMGWGESFATAVVKVIDAGLSATVGNAVYRQLVLDACDIAGSPYDDAVNQARLEVATPGHLPGVTACITYWQRPHALARLLRSLHTHLPDVPIEMVDTRGNLSRARNELARRCKTPFYLMLEEDFQVTSGDRIDDLLAVVQSDSGIAGAAGATIEEARQIIKWNHNFTSGDGEVGIEPTTTEKETAGGVTYQPCDLILNFGIFRRELFDAVKWDEALPVGEHRDFYLRASSKYGFAYVPSCRILHHRDRPNPTYTAGRNRGRHFEQVASSKHGATLMRGSVDPVGRPNVVVIGTGCCGSSMLVEQLGALGWNVPGVDTGERYHEHVALRDLLRGDVIDSGKLQTLINGLATPWVVKSPLFANDGVIDLCLEQFASSRPTLVWITRDAKDVQTSLDRRGWTADVAKRLANCETIYRQWRWPKITIDLGQIITAAKVVDVDADRVALDTEAR